jgi:DNA-binding transcriptional LysR family regulator
MNTHLLDIFLQVARERSFASVARAREMDPSTVSRLIAQLETQLGVRLFQRSTRMMTLTEAGERFVHKVEPLIDELGQAVEEAAVSGREPSGVLRLTSSVTFGQLRIVPLLPAFRARYPQIALECFFSDENVDLVAQRIDLAVRLAPAIAGDFVVTKLVHTRYRVVASPRYLRSAPVLNEPKDLAEHDCLLLPYRGFRDAWHFRRAGSKAAALEVPVHGTLTLSTPLALRDMAISHMGPALLPDWLVAPALAQGALVDVFPEHDVAATTFDTAAWLVYPSRNYLPLKVRVMIDFLKDAMHGKQLVSGAAVSKRG